MPGVPLPLNPNQHLPAGGSPQVAGAMIDTATGTAYQLPQGFIAAASTNQQVSGYVQYPHEPSTAIEWLNMEIGRVRQLAKV